MLIFDTALVLSFNMANTMLPENYLIYTDLWIDSKYWNDDDIWND